MTKHLSDIKAKTQSKYLVALIFLAAASLLIAGIVISYQVGISLLQAQQKMVEQLSIINRISDVMSNIKDVETGQRGYLLTREEPYLEPYKVAIGKLKIELSLLQELAAKGRVSQNQVDRITGLIQQKLDETNLTIDLNRKKGLSSALKIVKNDRGMVLMDQIRAELGSMRKDEESKFIEAGQNAQWASTLRTITFIGAGLVNLMFMAWACLRIIGDGRRREEISEEISRQKELLVTTLASIGDGVIITDDEGAILFMNPEAERLTGWRHLEAVGRALSEVFMIIDESTRQPVENPVEKVLRLESVLGKDNHTLLIRRDGTEIPVDDSTALIRQSDGGLFGVVLVFRDFTQHRKTENSLKTLNEQLSQLTLHLEKRVEDRTHQLEEQAGQLRQLAVELTHVEESERKRLAQILHDHLQQLLVAVKIRLELLMRKQHTDMDKSALSEMSSFIQQAYDSSRSLTAELRPPVLYESGLGPALKFLARKFEDEQKLKINLAVFSDAEPVSELFRVMLYQSVQEALLNIAKYAGTNECSLKMEKIDGNRIRVVVRDEGIGFDTEKIGQKGTGGFGLFSVRERIRALGGEFRIVSAAGQGTMLEMIVPNEAKVIDAQVFKSEGLAVPPVNAKGLVTVLIGDDHKIVRQSLARALLSEPFIQQVFEASNGQEVVDMVEAKNPNFIVMDFNMPVMNGLEATRILCQRNPNVKIIGLSVQAEEETIQTMKDAGAIEFFNKNEDIEILVKTLKNLIED